MWPAVLVAGMLVLLGAIGTATAPTARAAAGDVCGIFGPFPVLEEDTGDLDGHGVSGKLQDGEEYLFVAQIEDNASPDAQGSIDDKDGDAGFTSVAEDDGTFIDTNDADDTDLDVEDAATWIAIDPSAVNDALAAEEVDLTDFADCGDAATADGFAIFTVTCDDPGLFEITVFNEDFTGSSMTEEYLCVADANAATLTAVPTTVESSPARGNVSHSLLVLVLTDADGKPAAPGQDVDWTTDRCRIAGRTEAQYEGATGDGATFAGFTGSEASAALIETTYGPATHVGAPGTSTSISFENDANPSPTVATMRTIAVAILHCEGAAPGVATIAAEIERTGADLRATATVTVVGPPAFITMTAAPTKLVCGEKATILVTVTDAINQKVSDHTQVELITNYGGVLGGTGATLAFPGVNPVGPLSSGAAETFGGVATAYLLTSTTHVGAYEVVAAAGGSSLGAYSVVVQEGKERLDDVIYVGRSGVFSTPVVTSQVTVTCTLAAPAVTAPATGTGSISPPNTGDAGLDAPTSRGTTSLYVIFGAVAFVMAGLVSFGYARR
jgi:hypothetical protein